MRVAELRLPTLTAAEPSLLVVTTPGAGLLVRLFAWRGSVVVEGAGVLRAVLERRGRSSVVVVDDAKLGGSVLAALLRDEVGRFAGRAGRVSGAGVGVLAMFEDRLVRVVTDMSTLVGSFLISFIGSFFSSALTLL